LRSNDPVGLLRITSFHSLELEESTRFRDLYLDLRQQLALEGTAITLDRILV